MKRLNLIAIILIFNLLHVNGQSLEKTFENIIPKKGANISCIKEYSNGKQLISGDIQFYGEKKVNHLIRLNEDGTLDDTFTCKIAEEYIISEIEVLSNGDIVVFGRYDYKTGIFSENFVVAVIDSSGKTKKAIYPYYHPHLTGNENDSNEPFLRVRSIAIQNDDKILICGESGSHGCLKRYNKDLSRDMSFNDRVTFNALLTDVIYHDNRIITSGAFTTVNDTSANHMVKLKLDGSIDTTFSTGAGADNLIFTLTPQADGKILVGNFSIYSYNGNKTNGLIRINTDGSLDKSYNTPQSGGLYSQIFVKDSSLYLSCIYQVGSKNDNHLIKLKYDGSIDESFTPILMDKGGSFSFFMSFSGDEIIFNNATKAGTPFGLLKCDSNGNINKSFRPEVNSYGQIETGDYLNGQLIIAGDFSIINDIETYGVSKITTDGVVDTTFALKSNMGKVIQLELLKDSSMLVSTRDEFFKLNCNGNIENDFNYEKPPTYNLVERFIVTPNDKIYAANSSSVFRLNMDGSIDNTFNIWSGIDLRSSRFGFDLQSDKAIFGSKFNEHIGSNKKKLVRLNTDGSVDADFRIGTGPACEENNGIGSVIVLDNNEILITGEFLTFDGYETPYYTVKLSESGKVDSTFSANQVASNLKRPDSYYNYNIKQIGEKLYFFHGDEDELLIMNTDGTFDSETTLPFTTNSLNDIIHTSENHYNKNALVEDIHYVYALGSFNKPGSNVSSYIMKMKIENTISGSEVINKESDIDFKLFPNPASDEINIVIQDYSTSPTLSIHSLNGVRLYTVTVNQMNTKIDITNYPPGFYFVKVTTNDNRTTTQKIIKK